MRFIALLVLMFFTTVGCSNCGGAQRAKAIGSAEFNCVRAAAASAAERFGQAPGPMTTEQKHVLELELAFNTAVCMFDAAFTPAPPPPPPASGSDKQ